MRQDRLMQWLLRQRGFSPADTHSTSRSAQQTCHSKAVLARASLLAHDHQQTSTQKSFRGLRSLLHTDSTHTTAADAWRGRKDPCCFSTYLPAAPATKQQRSHRQVPFSTTAAQQSPGPLVKHLAAVFERNQASTMGSRRGSLDSVSTVSSLGAADAAVLVSVPSSTSKAQLESVPSIKGLLQTWESLSTQQQSHVLSRAESMASCSSSCSSSYHPQRPVLRPVLAAPAPAVATAAASAKAAAASSAAAAGVDHELQEQLVDVDRGTAIALDTLEAAVLGRLSLVSSAAALSVVGVYLVKACC